MNINPFSFMSAKEATQKTNDAIKKLKKERVQKQYKDSLNLLIFIQNRITDAVDSGESSTIATSASTLLNEHLSVLQELGYKIEKTTTPQYYDPTIIVNKYTISWN